MLKAIITRLLGIKSVGWANAYKRDDGTLMTGGMLYKTENEALEKGRLSGATSQYIGTKQLYY